MSLGRLSTIGTGVEIRTSGLGEAAGRGLFATRAFESGEYVTEYDGDKLERLRLLGHALQRHMRRIVGDYDLKGIHERAPAPELYWAIIVSMVDDGTVNANVLRRDAPDTRTLDLVKKDKQSICDPFWLAKLRAGPLWLSNGTASKPGELLSVQ